jgi:DNA polymerase III subunit epsilon
MVSETAIDKYSECVLPLTELEVLIVDCQATGASPRGHLMEIGWTRVAATLDEVKARLIALPAGAHVPAAVTRLTGIAEPMLHEGVDAPEAWRELLDEAAQLTQQPAPTVAHFARFERPFLRALAGHEPLPLEIVCTHEIAQRLFPGLPRRGLRALTGYFGRDLGSLRRSRDHVAATAFVWRELVHLLDAEGVTTWGALRDWLASPASTVRPGRARRRVWPMPRDLRLGAPDAPGVYRLQRTDGSVLYIGKAVSLRRRVNSYFRTQRGVPDRLLEMLSQARALRCDVTDSALEAALLESDEIKRHHPPYNVALLEEPRQIWFTTRDLGDRSARPSPSHPIGPVTSAMTLDRFVALANASPTALGYDRETPDVRLFVDGYARLCAAHPELSHEGLSPRVRLLQLGTRLWREGRRDRESESDEEFRLGDAVLPADIQWDLERVALRAALARRRARWVTRLVDATIRWQERGADRARLIVIERGEIVTREWVASDSPLPVPPGHARSREARHEGFTPARFDRLRVLITELKRLLSESAPVALRLSEHPAVTDARLAAALAWV